MVKVYDFSGHDFKDEDEASQMLTSVLKDIAGGEDILLATSNNGKLYINHAHVIAATGTSDEIQLYMIGDIKLFIYWTIDDSDEIIIDFSINGRE